MRLENGAEALRTFWGDKPKQKPDRLSVLKTEGFTALRGFGGAAALSTAENDGVHPRMVFINE